MRQKKSTGLPQPADVPVMKVAEFAAWVKLGVSTINEGCGGTGYFECYCAGDFCACSVMGEVRCPGCDDCIDDNYDADDMRL